MGLTYFCYNHSLLLKATVVPAAVETSAVAGCREWLLIVTCHFLNIYFVSHKPHSGQPWCRMKRLQPGGWKDHEDNIIFSWPLVSVDSAAEWLICDIFAPLCKVTKNIVFNTVAQSWPVEVADLVLSLSSFRQQPLYVLIFLFVTFGFCLH